MAIREDLVASAAQFLLDPSVANSSVENRVSFLRTKNLTQEEIDAALSRVGVQRPAGAVTTATGSPVPASQPQQYYPQQYPPQYAAWQPPPPVPKRDWRDWFIMATVVGGVGYGMYALTKRYVYPLIAPPTPERLEQDKKSIEEQFDKAFSLVEQLAKDTEALKSAEKERTEKLDTALADLESVIGDLKSANKRRDDEALRIREDIYNLKDSIPKAMDTQKDITDQRLKEINTELTSLKTLITQRMNASSSASTAVNGSLRPGSSTGAAPQSPGFTRPPSASVEQVAEGAKEGESPKTSAASTPAAKGIALGGAGGKASIPAWQMALANKSASGSSANGEAGSGSSSNQQEASGSA